MFRNYVVLFDEIRSIKFTLSETYCTNDDFNAKGQGQTSIIILSVGMCLSVRISRYKINPYQNIFWWNDSTENMFQVMEDYNVDEA